ncbi:hypothetical protein [Luteibacter aegosomatissinici]|uniref:hypothetical protein n=1 Tax=Luteibacter aegosomatissinici TaxID=2911539 RepID=UPI001FF9E329|nr:hypothetical protein [Luteibacter aegosomatissinici]UPG92769.1 hypothetical protein L2Y97_12930 [Luteibacter aegosomatissinici]
MNQSVSLKIRPENIRALCIALESRGLSGNQRLAAAFGPSMTRERLRDVLGGAPLPDFLARSIEHLMGVNMHWLDEPHQDVTGPAGHLLVEQALRMDSTDDIASGPALVPLLPIPSGA